MRRGHCPARCRCGKAGDGVETEPAAAAIGFPQHLAPITARFNGVFSYDFGEAADNSPNIVVPMQLGEVRSHAVPLDRQ